MLTVRSRRPSFSARIAIFAAALAAAGKRVTFLVGEGYNHLEIQETLGDPYGLLGRAVLEQMKLTRVYAATLRARTD